MYIRVGEDKSSRGGTGSLRNNLMLLACGDYCQKERNAEALSSGRATACVLLVPGL